MAYPWDENPSNWVFDYSLLEDILVPVGDLPSLDSNFKWTQTHDAVRPPASLRFQDLSSVLEPGKPPKTDKVVILNDVVSMVIQLRKEAQRLQESCNKLQENVKELKVIGGKMVPFVGYPGISMWQLMPPAASAAFNTSDDHSLHPPVA